MTMPVVPPNPRDFTDSLTFHLPHATLLKLNSAYLDDQARRSAATLPAISFDVWICSLLAGGWWFLMVGLPDHPTASDAGVDLGILAEQEQHNHDEEGGRA